MKKIFMIIGLIVVLLLGTGIVGAVAYHQKIKDVESHCYDDGYRGETYLFNFSKDSDSIEWHAILMDDLNQEKIEVIPKKLIKNDLENKADNEYKFELLKKSFDDYKKEFIFSSDFKDVILYYTEELGYSLIGITYSYVVDLKNYKDITCDFSTCLFGSSDITDYSLDVSFSSDDDCNDSGFCRANFEGFGNTLGGESYHLSQKNKLTVTGRINFDSEDSSMRFSIKRMNVTGDRYLLF